MWGLDIIGPTGLRKFTAHSARASGAVHMARTQIELWRVQLFGRWGSEIFKQCVRDAPLEQLHSLAQEVSLKSSLASARAELAAILEATKEAQTATAGLADQPVAAYMDCPLPHYLWWTKCFWYFARGQADYALLTDEPQGSKCSKCFKPSEQDKSDESSSSSSRSRSSES